MKRQPILVCLALLLVIGAALWGVNYRLDHPPLTKADKRLAKIVEGADGATIEKANCPIEIGCDVDRSSSMMPISLNAAQTRALIQHIRLLDGNTNLPDARSFGIEIVFTRQGAILGYFRLYRDDVASALLFQRNAPYQTYKVHPRFEKRFRDDLNRIAPKFKDF